MQSRFSTGILAVLIPVMMLIAMLAFATPNAVASDRSLSSPSPMTQEVPRSSSYLTSTVGEATVDPGGSVFRDNVITAMGESNNLVSSEMVTRSPGIDLWAVYVFPPQDGLVAGHAGKLDAWVSNIGELTADDVAVRFYRGDPRQDGVQIGETQVITQLPPGETRIVQTIWTPEQMGTEAIYAWVDPDNVIAEADENNNLTLNEMTVRAPGIDLALGSVWSSQTEFVVGYATELTTGIHNAGELAADNVTLRFYRGDPQQGGVQIGETQVITQIPPGEYRLAQVTWTPDQVGTETIYAWVDPDNAISEIDEDNNLTWADFHVREADLSWYVDGAVQASGNGHTPETAFKTIDEAMQQALAGDTVHVASGHYVEQVTLPPGVTLLGAGLANTIIDGDGTAGSVVWLAPDNVLEGFTVTGGDSGIGIWSSPGSVTVHNNRITGNSAGISLWCVITCDVQISIEDNIIDNNTSSGISSDASSTLFMRNNTVVNNGGSGVILTNAADVAENNIIAGNAGWGLANNVGATVRYNDVWGNGQDYVDGDPGEGGLSMDPMFRDSSAEDYQLHAGSPAVEHGTPDGTDMGALSFVPVGTPPAGVQVNHTGDFEWTVTWNNADAAGYNVYLGTSSGFYAHRFDAGNATAYVLSGLPGNLTYYVAVSRYNGEGDESVVSEEVSFAVPPAGTGTYQEDSPVVLSNGDWTEVNDGQASGSAYMVSDTPGDTVQFTFNGDSIVLLRRIDADGGRAKVNIDGKFYGFLDFYFIEQRWQVPAVFDNLGSGVHTLTLRVDEQNADESAGHQVYIDAFTVPSPYTPNSAQQQALERVNWYRQLAGLPLSRSVQAIHLGAQSHAEFVANNQDDPRLAGLGFHQEHPDLPGYVGQWPSARARYFGYDGGLGEDGHFVGDPIRSVDGWMETVYHRNLIMCWNCTDLGYGIVNDDRGRFDVLNMGTQIYSAPSERLLYTYPVGGQIDVPARWHGGEMPDPLPGKPKPVGYPVSLHIQQPEGAGRRAVWSAQTPWLAPQRERSDQWRVTVAELRDETGNLIPSYLLEQNTDPYLGPDVVFLIAHEPMAEDATYFVRIAGIDSQGVAFDRSWAFATGSTLNAPDLRASHFWSEPVAPTDDGPITFFIELINTGPPAQGVTVTVDIPENGVYVPGSAVTSQGTVTVGERLDFDVGTVTGGASVTLSYAVTVDDSGSSPLAVRAPVDIAWMGGSFTREQGVIINGLPVYLPLVADE